MPANDFKAFAIGGGANVLDQATFAAASFLGTGFLSGIAQSAHMNKVWRQSAFVAAGIAEYIMAQNTEDVLDDGDLPGFVAQLTAAIAAAGAGVTSYNGRLGAVTGIASDVTNALTYTPANRAGDTMLGILTLAQDPVGVLDAATKQYVDNAAVGLKQKDSVKAASTGNLTLSGTQTIDGVAVIATQRVLVKDQSLPANNGIWVCAAGAWARATDMDAWAEVPGAYVFVEGGTVNGKTGWSCTSGAGGTLNTTAITWAQFSASTSYSAGTGLTLGGSVFSITAGGVGTTQLADAGVTNAKLANMSAGTIKGRLSTTGAPQDLTGAQVAGLMSLSDIGGTITAGQIGSGIVTNAKLANMAGNTIKGRLSTTGAPQDLTVAQVSGLLDLAGMTSTVQSLVANGYFKVGGLIIQWGTASVSSVGTGTSGEAVVTFPLTFPTAIRSYVATANQPSGAIGSNTNVYVRSPSTTGMRIGLDENGSSPNTWTVAWVAIGS